MKRMLNLYKTLQCGPYEIRLFHTGVDIPHRYHLPIIEHGETVVNIRDLRDPWDQGLSGIWGKIDKIRDMLRLLDDEVDD